MKIAHRWPPSSVVTERFELRELRPNEQQAFLGLIDDEVRRRQGYDDRTVKRYAKLFSAINSGSAPAQRFLVVVVGGEVVGQYTITPSRTSDVDVDLGWWLGASVRGQGLGRATLSAVLDHLHHDLELDVVRMGTAVDNVPAVRQIEAVGAARIDEGDHKLPNGHVVLGRWYHHTAPKR